MSHMILVVSKSKNNRWIVSLYELLIKKSDFGVCLNMRRVSKRDVCRLHEGIVLFITILTLYRTLS